MTTPAVSVSPRPWRLATLAGMASYLDAGSIVAVATSLALWQALFGMSPLDVGLLSGALTVCIAIGSLAGGRFGDRFGRKRIYAIDLLVYAAGVALLTAAVHPAMLFAGVVVMGLAIGADIPASLALVGEMAPPEKRGRLIGFTQLLWALGPVAVIIVAFASSGLGEWMPRLIFAHLLVVALITWALRRRIPESAAWKDTAASSVTDRRLSSLFRSNLARALAFTTTFYVLITIASNFFGQFGTYMLITVGGLDQTSAVGANFLLIPVGIILGIVFLRLVDTRWRALTFYVGAALQAGAFTLLLFLPAEAGPILASMVIYVAGVTLAGEGIYKVWSQELFPTALRGTSQGFSFGIARLVSAVFAVFIPTLLAVDFRLLAGLLVAVLTAAGLIGVLFMPRRYGLTIAEIDAVAGETPAAGDPQARDPQATVPHTTEKG